MGQAVSLQTECHLKSSRLGETEESDFSYYSPEVFTGNTQENRISHCEPTQEILGFQQKVRKGEHQAVFKKCEVWLVESETGEAAEARNTSVSHCAGQQENPAHCCTWQNKNRSREIIEAQLMLSLGFLSLDILTQLKPVYSRETV